MEKYPFIVNLVHRVDKTARAAVGPFPRLEDAQRWVQTNQSLFWNSNYVPEIIPLVVDAHARDVLLNA